MIFASAEVTNIGQPVIAIYLYLTWLGKSSSGKLSNDGLSVQAFGPTSRTSSVLLAKYVTS